jgi:septal ring factor EnvC (AmiA/AmiB activator)
MSQQPFVFNFQSSIFNRWYLFFIPLFLSISVFAQDKTTLEEKRKALQEEIQQINSLLSETRKNEKTLLIRLNDINQKINVRQRLINTINSESLAFSKKIKQNRTKIANIEIQLKKLKKDYSKMVVQSYKSKNKQSKLLFLLSSDNFLQAYKRVLYMKQYANFRKKQANDILIKKETLITLNDSLKIRKKAKDLLVAEQLKEKSTIDSEKKSQQKLIKSVKKKMNKYLTQIRKKQKEERKFERQLENLIKGAIVKSSKSSSKKTSSFVLTPEAKKLASNFVANKGKLPAPVEKGFVSRFFGERQHEVLKKIKIKSNGWYYTTPKNTKARAVFKGTVLGIMVDRKTKLKTVLVQHGNYVTTYKNLKSLLVKKGDKLDTKQILGTIHTDKTTGKTVLGFVLWKNAKPQNPSNWIFRN